MRVGTSTWLAGVFGAALLLSSAAPVAAAQEPAAAPEPDGAALYRQQCRSCHGARGVPPARMVTLYPALKTLADSSLQAHLTTDSIVAVLRHGKGKDMKSFTDKLSPAEMLAVARFVKSLGAPAPTGP
ncbi:MAG: c-type cytochrome [Gemmatimonadales bacterium]